MISSSTIRIDNTFKDEIIGRLDNIDQELSITNGYNDKLEDHEQRIAHLEEKQATAV